MRLQRGRIGTLSPTGAAEVHATQCVERSAMEHASTWSSTYEIGTGVVSRLIGDETVLVHLGSEMYYGLNRTGSVVWAGLENRTPVPDIISAIVDRFDVSTERATADVRALLDELERLGLARRSP